MNQSALRGAFAAAAAFVLASCGSGDGGDSDACPAQADVELAITHHVTDESWSETERYIWKVSDVTGFKFGAIKAGHVIDKQVEYGRSAEPVCPIRVEYDYVIKKMDGTTEAKHDGAGTTYLFYRNGFDEWVFKTD